MDDQPSETRLLSDMTLAEVENPITLRAIIGAFVAGFAGLVVMAPVAIGIPIWLDLFEINSSAGFGYLVNAAPSQTLTILFFIAGGGIVVPLFFLVTATYLPPETPRFVRGVTMSLIFWPGFVIAFWPFADSTTNAVFLVFSLLSHLLYGLVLGVGFDVLTGIPEHDV